MTTNTPTTYKKNELDTHKKDDSKFDVIHFLQKGVYDINFCIHMLRQIQDHADKYKFSLNFYATKKPATSNLHKMGL